MDTFVKNWISLISQSKSVELRPDCIHTALQKPTEISLNLKEGEIKYALQCSSPRFQSVFSTIYD